MIYTLKEIVDNIILANELVKEYGRKQKYLKQGVGLRRRGFVYILQYFPIEDGMSIINRFQIRNDVFLLWERKQLHEHYSITSITRLYSMRNHNQHEQNSDGTMFHQLWNILIGNMIPSRQSHGCTVWEIIISMNRTVTT